MSNKIKDVLFKCPKCGDITQAYARVDEYSRASDTAGVINSNGKLVIDWDNLDVNLDFEYVCAHCDDPVASSLEELESIVRKYEEAKRIPDELMSELAKIQASVGTLRVHADGVGNSYVCKLTDNILSAISDAIEQCDQSHELLEKDPELNQRINTLKYMDQLIRCVNDEENGVVESWMSLGIPDGSTEDDYIEFAKDNDTYNELCVLWAELMSSMLMEGDWNKSGYTVELYHKTSK